MSEEYLELPHIEWLQDWKRTQVRPAAQRDYVASELKRIHEEGAPVLLAALTAPLEVQSILALSVLARGELGQDIFRLRLRPGCVPPPLDPQGRPVPPAKKGQLIAKVETIGNRVSPDAGPEVTAELEGFALRAKEAMRRDIFTYRTITPYGVDLKYEHAMAVLRKWGAGVVFPRMTGGRKKPAQDHWLVVEDCPMWNEILGPVPTQPPPEKPAQKAKPVKQAEAA